MKPETKNLILYIAKCVTGCLIVFLLSWLLDFHDISWCIISVMLVLTPESNEALSLAITRIKANLIAGASSMLCLLSGFDNVVTICISIIITITLCYKFKVMAGSRAAIAAVIIIMLHGQENNEPHFWSATIARVLAVVVGCAIGLIVTLVFQKNLLKNSLSSGRSDEG